MLIDEDMMGILHAREKKQRDQSVAEESWLWCGELKGRRIKMIESSAALMNQMAVDNLRCHLDRHLLNFI